MAKAMTVEVAGAQMKSPAKTQVTDNILLKREISHIIFG